MSTPIYFGGSTVHGGHIRRLNAANFKEFVERNLCIPIPFPLTRAEFHALPEKERNRRKDCAYYVAASYPFEEGHRQDDTATSFHMVVLDLDEGEFIKDFVESPETIGEHLWPYSFAAYNSASSTPEKPRLKIVIDVHPSHPSLHKRFVNFFVRRLGIPDDFKGVRESRTLSQPQYRTISFRGETTSAVIALRLDGIAARESDLPEEEEAEANEEFHGRTFACDRRDEDDSLGLAFLPVPGLTVDDIREPLSKIDPDCDRTTWTSVIAGLRHQFIDEESAEEAFNLFEEWSSTASEKYAGRRDCWEQWRSYRAYAKGRAPITIRSMLKTAIAAGWEPTKVAAKVQLSLEEWLDACHDKDTLMQETAKRIVALPLCDDVTEEALVIHWRKRIKAVTGNDIDKATLKKAVSKARRREAATKQDSHKKDLPSWLHPICYVAVPDVFYNFGTGVALKPVAFDRYFEKELMPKDGAETPANGKPILSPSAYALNLMDIPRVEETIYNPTRGGEDSFYELNGRSYLNTYKKDSVPIADPTHAERAGALITKHAGILIAEPELQRYFIDFLAHLVQLPGIKVKWAFIIQSAQGAGKGTVSEIMQAVLGKVNVKNISATLLKSSYNEWAQGCVLAVLEEVHLSGEIRDHVMNNLKQIITDPVITIMRKYHDAACDTPNFINLIAFTNKKDSLSLTENDRRWCVVQSPLQNAKHIAELNASGHFNEDQMRWLITDEGASALRYWLLKRKISPDFPVNGPAPRTKYRAAVIEESKSPLQIQIEDLIEDAVDPLIGREVIHVGRLVELVARGRHSDATRVPHVLGQMGFEKYDSNRHTIDGSRGAIYTHAEAWKNGVPPTDFLKARLVDFEDGFLI